MALDPLPSIVNTLGGEEIYVKVSRQKGTVFKCISDLEL
jgi:hypothetical protein